MSQRRGHRVRPQLRLPYVPVRFLLPNLVTLLALCSGLSAIRLAIEGRIEWALIAIVLASILDGLDGRLARLLKGTSRFGAELDSLTDFVNFGVAPALILYVWILSELRNLGWVGALGLAIAAALRLARFNVELDDPDQPSFAGQFFKGAPAPAGAICVLLPIYLVEAGLPKAMLPPPLVLAYTLAIAWLMASTLPTFSVKNARVTISRDWVMAALLATSVFVGLLATYTWTTMVLCTLVYLATLPFSVTRYRRLATAYRAKMPLSSSA